MKSITTTIYKSLLLASLFLFDISAFSQAGGATCPNMEPICTNAGINFQALSGGSDVTVSEPGNDYGCLGYSPNPSWFYFEIATAGDIIMELSASSDIDFIIWGPYSSLANAQANCGNHQNIVPDINCGFFGCDAEGCSYSTAATEYPGIPNAQVGEVYVMLITNYANNVQNITLTQTGGSGATDCSIVFPCAIDNFTANIGSCNAGTNTYDITGTVQFSSPPPNGNLIVQDCSGTQHTIASAPFSTSAVLNYNVNGLTADGAPCSLNVYFDSDPSCTDVINYTAPNPCNSTCSISSVTRNVGNCVAGNTYSISGQVSYVNAPSSGDLTISSSCGGTFTYSHPFPASPVSYNFSGLPADGSTCTVTASFSATACTLSGDYTAPTIPTANAGPSQILSCSASTVALSGSSATSGATYSWSGPGIVSGGNTATPSVNVAGAYTVTVTDPTYGCTNTSSVNVTSDTSIPNVDAGAPQDLDCATTSVVLNGSSSTSGVTFSWSGPGIVSGGNTTTPTVNQAGSYTLTVTDPTNNCTASASVNVTQTGAIPNIDPGTTQTINCSNSTTSLNGSSSTAGATFSWTEAGIVSGGNTATPTVNQAGTYTLTVTDPSNGCTSNATVDVVEDITPPDANAGASQVLSCSITSVNLNGSSATSGATFSWSGPGVVSGGNTATPTVDQAGTYTITVTDPANGCTSTASTTVTNDLGLPNVDAGLSQTLNCSVNSVVLGGSSSTSGATYSWSGPGIVSGGNTATPTVDQPGTYTLTVTDPTNGCTSSEDVDILEDITPPDANAGNTAELNCIFTELTLNGSSTTSGATYSWSGPGIVSGGNSSSPIINQPGTYTVTVTNPVNTCTSTADVDITQNITQPNISFVADTLIGCGFLPVNFQENSGQTGMNYFWSFGNGNTSNTGSSVSEIYPQVGCYDVSLMITDPTNGCTNTETKTDYICVIAQPEADFTVSPTVFETLNGVVNFSNNSSNATDYVWDFGDETPTSTVVDPSHDYSSYAGNFTIQLVASNQGICFDTAYYQVQVKESEIFYIPNTFTPDGDSYNETFKAVFTSGFDPYNYTMLIYDRWGEIIWESHDWTVGWNGTFGGNIVQDGIYTWKIEVKTTSKDDRRIYTGHVNVIR